MATIAELFDQALRHQKDGKAHDAAQLYRRVLRLDAHHADARNNLGIVLFQQGQFPEAAECFRQTLSLNPNHPEARTNLGTVLFEQGQLPEAAACFRQSLQLNPNDADTHTNLGNLLRTQGLLDEAGDCFRRALQLNPHHAEAYNGLGNVFKDQGRIEDAGACYGNAWQRDPNNLARASNYLFTLSYHPRLDAPAIYAELRRWAQSLPHFPTSSAYANDPSPERRLRIGYVSPDFRDHVVGRNVWPLLRLHDHQRFEVTLYAYPPRADALTEQFRKCADHWCPITGWNDQQVADKIRRDKIDVLVDLVLHTSGNRLMVFARKPAPVQVTFAGYPGSTGLAAIDYRLTDPYLDPPGLFEGCHSETSYRLPHSFWCYDPGTDLPHVSRLPALANNHITFGCLNNFCKINNAVLELWARVLRGVPGSRLLLLAKQGSHRQRTIDLFERQGVAGQRIVFYDPKPRPEYLALYHNLDIGLDTFPYNGHTTSLDSSWMGVPVVTFVGQTVVGRGGLSQLTNLGMPELAATTPDAFVAIAVGLAGDGNKLKEMRAGLRERMRQSPLMDAAGFTRGIEEAYRTMWRRWCAQSQV